MLDPNQTGHFLEMTMVIACVIACAILVWTVFFTMAGAMAGVIHFEITHVRIVHLPLRLYENSNHGNGPCHICACVTPSGLKF